MNYVTSLTLLLTALALPAFPQDGPAWFARGNELQRQRKLPEARDAFQHAIDLKFRPPFSMAMIGRAYAAAGDSARAQEWLEKASTSGFAQPALLDSDPDFASIKSQPWFQAIHARVELNAKPCLSGGPYRQFDFWLGEWNVEVSGKSVARSRIEKIGDGCIVQENWMPFQGIEGKSWNFFNASTGKWEQLWISGGGVLKLAGEATDGAMHYTGRTPLPNSAFMEERLTFTPIPGGRVHQFWEQSRDGGKTWTVAFDGIYIRSN